MGKCNISSVGCITVACIVDSSWLVITSAGGIIEAKQYVPSPEELALQNVCVLAKGRKRK